MSQTPKVLRTVTTLLADLDLASEEYPSDILDFTDEQLDTLVLEWETTKGETGETFSVFFKRRLPQ
jgi:hypothetical protein